MNSFIQRYLLFKEENTSLVRTWLYITIAFLFSLAVRSLLYFHAVGIENFWFEGRPLPIWSPDAGLYGYYAKQILAGHSYSFTAEYMPGYLVAFAVNLTGISIDNIMFWLPALLASLIVVPIVLIAKALRLTTLGFIAALIGAISANYYTRTHLGYMDTDTLNLVLPWTAIMFWVFTLTRKRLHYAFLGALSLLLFRMWYHSSAPILAGVTAGLLLVVLIFYRKERIGWQAVLLAGIAITPFSYLLSFGTMTAAALLFFAADRQEIGPKPYLVLFGLALISAPFFLNLDQYIQRAKDYFDKPETINIATGHGIYHFSNVLSTVIEAGGAPIWQINPMFSGMAFYILPALIGFILFSMAYRVLWVAAPLLILGLLSSVAGIRFAMFASPALALGFAYIGFLLAKELIDRQRLRPLIVGGLSLAAIALMVFNIVRLNPHLKPFYFLKPEAKALQSFTAHSTPKDLILSWWDYGWPLWYYTGRDNTLIDNGRHGSDTFYIANMLLSSNPVFVANSAKFADATKNTHHLEVTPVIAENGDIFDKFREFSNPKTVVPSPADAYIMLHRDMLAILPTIASVANKDPRTGQPTRQQQFYISNLLRPYTGKEPLLYGDTFTLDLRNGTITGNDGASARIGGVVISENGKLKVGKRYDKHSPMIMIVYNKTKALYMDTSVFNSFLIQALVLNRYDHERFEEVADTGIMKLFKVR